jgi:guanylate kinase
MSQRGLLLILSSPSGAGKSTLAKRLIAKNPSAQFSVSATTRDPRPGEVEGKDYYFRSHAAFNQMVADGEMLEYATVFENSYGSPRGPVVEAMEAGRDVIFDVDWQGGQQIRVSDLAEHVVSVFILPPSIAELERRLKSRGQDSPETVERRMKQARSEISHWPEYDYVLINENLETCEAELDQIIAAERLRRVRQLGLVDKVRSLNDEFEAR